jgi:translation initiation factor IF-3
LRVNERIRVPEIRVIDENGEQLGILRTREALATARQRNLDLVEVAPTAQPPVCRIMDYGKYRYEQTKKERDARKNQKVIEVKEVRLTPKIDDHDVETKARQARGFVEDGHKVKLSVKFRGRENAHPEIGRDLLLQFADLLKDVAVVEQPARLEGKSMTMLLNKSASKAAPGSDRAERPTAQNVNRPNTQARPPREPNAAAPATSNGATDNAKTETAPSGEANPPAASPDTAKAIPSGEANPPAVTPDTAGQTAS